MCAVSVCAGCACAVCVRAYVKGVSMCSSVHSQASIK